MIVYVVALNSRNGKIEQGVFSTQEKAQEYVSNQILPGCHWFEMTVVGEQKEPGYVFSASCYDPTTDEFFFDKIFGSYEKADQFYKQEKKMILRRKIN